MSKRFLITAINGNYYLIVLLDLVRWTSYKMIHNVSSVRWFICKMLIYTTLVLLGGSSVKC